MTPESDRPRARQRTGSALATTALVGLLTALAPTTAASAAPPPGTAPSPHTSGPFQTVETQETDHDGDGVIDLLWTWMTEYDSRGNVVTASGTLVDPATDELLQFNTTVRHYNDAGQLTLSVTESGFGDVVEERELTEQFYDDRGDLRLIVRQYDMNADGTVESTETSTIAGGGRSLSSTTTSVWTFAFDDFAGSTVTVTTDRDRRGRILATTESTDFESDGITDMIVQSRFSYSARGAITSETGSTAAFGEYSEWIESSEHSVSFEYNARGLISRSQAVSSSSPTFTQTFAYTARGDLSAYTSSVDYEGDGVVDELAVGGASYDARGRLVSGILEVTSPSGMGMEYVQVVAATYDRRGAQTQTIDEDYGADGTVDARTLRVSTVDSRGRIIAESVTVDGDADGVVDMSWSASASYTRTGDLLSRTFTMDANADGIAEETFTFTRTAL